MIKTKVCNDSADTWNANEYPESGIYKVLFSDKNITSTVVFVNKITNIVTFIGGIDVCQVIEEQFKNVTFLSNKPNDTERGSDIPKDFVLDLTKTIIQELKK